MRAIAVTATILALLIVGTTGALLLMPKPQPAPAVSEANTQIYAELLGLNLTDILVDATPERVLIRYEAIAGLDPELVARAAHPYAGGAPVILQAFREGALASELTCTQGAGCAPR